MYLMLRSNINFGAIKFFNQRTCGKWLQRRTVKQVYSALYKPSFILLKQILSCAATNFLNLDEIKQILKVSMWYVNKKRLVPIFKKYFWKNQSLVRLRVAHQKSKSLHKTTKQFLPNLNLKIAKNYCLKIKVLERCAHLELPYVNFPQIELFINFYRCRPPTG